MITVKYKRWLIIAPALAVVLFIFSAQTAQAQGFGPAAVTITQGFLEGVAKLLAAIVLFILQAVSGLAIVFVHLLIFIAQQNVFINAQIVQTGWALVKDVSNMIFIVALLVIAVGTILRLENYRYNRLLGRVVVMAFLVNFSMLIAGFFIQAGQVVMLTFVNAFKDAAFGNFASMFGLKDVLKLTTNTFEVATLPTILISLIAGLAMMVTVMVVLLAICVVLAVRIIALWILIILSPLAFALRIVPNTEKYYSQWWSEFTKYVTVGPVLAFFLWLAMALHSGSDLVFAPDAIKTYEQESGYIDGFATQNLTFDTFITFFISIIFLIMGLQYAQKSGGAGGAFAGRVAQKGFAAARVLTGLNAVRDRTIAPVQGWISNRQQAARARVAERTLTLEGAGARTRAALGRTPVGRALLPGGGTEKAQASANQVERQQQGAFAAQRGYDQMTSVQLQQNLRNTGTSTTDRRMRLAAMETLKKRKELNLEEPEQRSAFEGIVNEERMPLTERKRIIDEVADSNIKSASEDQLRRDADLSDKEVKDEAKRIGKKELSQKQIDALFERKKDMRIRAIEELDRRQLLNLADKRPDYGGETGKNRKLYKQLSQDLVVSPEKTRQFRENMMKNNQAMAMNFLFNDLKGAGDVTDYNSALQQGQISTSSMTKGLYDSLITRGQGSTVAKVINHLKDVSPDEEKFRSYIKNIDHEDAHLWTGQLDMKGETKDRRAMVAKVTGEWGRAFEDEAADGTRTMRMVPRMVKKMNEATGKEEDVSEMVSEGQEYFDRLGGGEISKNITNGALKKVGVQRMIKKSGNFRWKDLEYLRSRDEETREAMGDGLQAYMDELPPGSKPGTIELGEGKITDKQREESTWVAQQLFMARKGEVNPYDLADTSTEGGKEKFTDAVHGSKAADISALHKSDRYQKDPDYKKLVDATVGKNLGLGELADLLLMKKKFAVDAIEAAEAALTGSNEKGALNRLRLMSKHPIIGKLMRYTQKYPGDEGEGGGSSKGGPGDEEPPEGGSGPKGPDGGSSGPGGSGSGSTGRGKPKPRGGGGGGSQAEREAARARARPGGKILLPGWTAADRKRFEEEGVSGGSPEVDEYDHEAWLNKAKDKYAAAGRIEDSDIAADLARGSNKWRAEAADHRRRAKLAGSDEEKYEHESKARQADVYAEEEEASHFVSLPSTEVTGGFPAGETPTEEPSTTPGRGRGKETFRIGDSAVVRRSSGAMEKDWYVASFQDQDNTVVVRKANEQETGGFIQKVVPHEEFIQWQKATRQAEPTQEREIPVSTLGSTDKAGDGPATATSAPSAPASERSASPVSETPGPAVGLNDAMRQLSTMVTMREKDFAEAMGRSEKTIRDSLAHLKTSGDESLIGSGDALEQRFATLSAVRRSDKGPTDFESRRYLQELILQLDRLNKTLREKPGGAKQKPLPTPKEDINLPPA